MPYDSARQRRFMHARHPGIAARWDQEIRDARRKKDRVTKIDYAPRFAPAPVAVGKRREDDEPPYSKRRRQAAVQGGATYGLVHAHPGRKRRAMGRFLAEGVGGSMVGGGLGALAFRGKPGAQMIGSQLGAVTGGMAGNYHAFRAVNRKGYLKPEPERDARGRVKKGVGLVRTGRVHAVFPRGTGPEGLRNAGRAGGRKPPKISQDVPRRERATGGRGRQYARATPGAVRYHLNDSPTRDLNRIAAATYGAAAAAVGGVYGTAHHIDAKAKRSQTGWYAKADALQRFGSGAPVGRRIAAADLVEKRDRNFDPEAARQRRLGAGAALAGAGGAGLLYRGGRQIKINNLKTGRVARVPLRAAGQAGGGLAGLGAAAGISRYARSRRNNRWE